MYSDSIPDSWLEIPVAEINDHKSANIKPSDFPEEVFELYSVPTFPTGKPEFICGSEIGSSKQMVEPGDVLLCKINPRINRVWWVPKKKEHRQIASSEWIVIRQPKLEPLFLVNYFSEYKFRDLLCSEVSGVGGSLTRAQPKKVATYPVRIAPLNEQTRIANKLDELLAQVDTIKARVDAIPAILKRFRQSVLAAAVSGKLTEEWRDAEGLPPIEQVDLGSLISYGPQNGLYKGKNFYGEGTRIVRIDGFYDGELVPWENMKRLQLEDEEFERWKLNVSDVLVNRVNSIEYLGKSAFVRDLPEPAVFESNIMRIQLDEVKACPQYIVLFLSSAIGLSRLRENAKRAVNQASINQQDVKNCVVEFPHIEEQKQIVQRVEQLCAFADQIEQRVKEAQARIDNLSQSILAKAFRGELVPQDPNDEPASELLERIRQEREVAVKLAKAAKKAGKNTGKK